MKRHYTVTITETHTFKVPAYAQDPEEAADVAMERFELFCDIYRADLSDPPLPHDISAATIDSVTLTPKNLTD